MTDVSRQMVNRFSPLLFAISLVLILSGAAVLLYFGYTAYELIQAPEQSGLLKYILSQLPEPPADSYTFKMISDGKPFEIVVPAAFLGYGRFLVAFMIWGMLGGLFTTLLNGGIAIFRALADKPAEKRMSVTE